MAWLITNYGNSRNLPYKNQSIFIAKNGSIETNNSQMAKVLGKCHMVDAIRLPRQHKSSKAVKK